MNLFLLLSSELCDKHVVKMPLEAVQVLCTVIRKLSGDTVEEEWRSVNGDTKLYRSTHAGHPITVWASLCAENFQYVCDKASSLFEEYTYRYERRHASQDVLDAIHNFVESFPIRWSGSAKFSDSTTMVEMTKGCTPFPLVTGGIVVSVDGRPDGEESYKECYRQKEKDITMTWKGDRMRPDWMSM